LVVVAAEPPLLMLLLLLAAPGRFIADNLTNCVFGAAAAPPAFLEDAAAPLLVVLFDAAVLRTTLPLTFWATHVEPLGGILRPPASGELERKGARP